MSYPRLHKDLKQHNDRVRQQFIGAFNRPLLIVGNGPSSASPLLDRMPEDPLVFRMNWFFLEGAQRYGSRVDGYFWSIDNRVLQDELDGLVRAKSYDIRSFFAPMRPLIETLDGRTIDDRFSPMFDHWAVLAEHPEIARNFMGRPLPTQGFQVLAFALALGFRDIYLTGIDLYASSDERYPFTVPDRVARRLPPKDLTPGYENDHSYDRDISFFEMLLESFSEASIQAIAHSPFFDAFVPLAPSKGGAVIDISSGQSHPIEEHVPGRMMFQDDRTVDLAETEDNEGHFAELGGLRCAYVTLVSGEGFHWGLRVLARSLAKVSDVPLVVMCLPDTNKRLLREPNVVLLDVEPIENPNQLEPDKARFAATYSKLALFGLEAWDRLVYLDADTLVLQPIDELFQHEEFAAAPDLGIDLYFDRFNSGVFCAQPSSELFEQMMSAAETIVSYDGGDQGFLNEFFSEPKLLDRSYNTLKRLYVHHPNLFNFSDVKVIHFVGPKPWQYVGCGDSRYAGLDARWLAHLTKAELMELLATPRRRHKPVPVAPEPRPAATRTKAPPTKPDKPAPAEKKKEDAEKVRLSRFERKVRKLVRDPVKFVRDARLIRAVTSR